MVQQAEGHGQCQQHRRRPAEAAEYHFLAQPRHRRSRRHRRHGLAAKRRRQFAVALQIRPAECESQPAVDQPVANQRGAAQADAGKIDWSRADVDGRFARAFGGVEGSGKNPKDRGRPGVKRHVLGGGHGIPLAGDLTPANTPEVKALLPLVDSAGPLDGQTGEPDHRPGKVYGDRAYDSDPHREALRERGIEPKLAKRYTAHGSGLGKVHWVVERFFSWAHGFSKPRLVTDKAQEMRFAFFNLAIALICLRFL